jgi:hypothetical protein
LLATTNAQYRNVCTAPEPRWVHLANLQYRVAARAVLTRLFYHFKAVTRVFADSGSTGNLI